MKYISFRAQPPGQLGRKEPTFRRNRGSINRNSKKIKLILFFLQKQGIF